MDEKDNQALKIFAGNVDKEAAFVFTRQPGMFSLLGSCAVTIARDIVKTMSVLKNWGSDEFPIFVVNLNEAVLKASISYLVGEHNKTVLLHEKKDDGYGLTDTITTVTLADFEDDNETETKSTVSLRCGLFIIREGNEFKVSLSTISTSSRCIMFSSFTDSYQLLNLETLLAQCSVKDVSVAQLPTLSEEDIATLKQVSKRCGANVKLEQPTAFNAAAALKQLPSLLRADANLMQLTDYPDCLRCVGYLVQSLGSSRCFQLQHLQPHSLLRLDTAAIDGLSIVSANEAKSKLPVSIFGWLNQCVTAMGSRVLRQWLLQPSTNFDEISARHDMLQTLIETPSMKDALVSSLKRLADVDRVGRRIVRQCASLREVFQLKGFVESLSQVIAVLNLSSNTGKKVVVDEYTAPLGEMVELMANLVTLLDATIEVTADNEFRIRPDFDDELQQLDESRIAVRNSIDEEYQQVLKSNKWTDKICKCEIHASYGFVFRVSRKDDKGVRDSKTLTLLSTSKDGVRFTSNKLNDLSQQYKDYSRTYDTRQQSLHLKLVETVATYLPVLDDAKERIARLDIFAAWAGVIAKSKLPMVRPQFTSDDVTVEEVWHPLVELRVPNFIPNSISLANNASTAIITGPNMGGKSTFMRSLGIVVLLAQIGCYVPARVAKLAIRDAIMCRIGASDFLAHGMSTFMVEMLETSSIVASATNKSLVIIDELGRGTSTYDGFGLAWAVAEFLTASKKCWLLFSTHFHEMTDLASENTAVNNFHFAGNTVGGELHFSFSLLPGPSTKSFGIAVAEHAKLPKSLIEQAKQRADELEDFAAETLSLTVEQQQRMIELSTMVSKVSTDPQSLSKLKEVIMGDPILADLLR